MSTELYSGSSTYGSYRVVDTIYNNRPARVLYGSDNSPQSGVARDDDPELLFDYNQRFMEMIMSRQPHKLLVIGGGACTLPTAAHTLFPNLAIDVVEIDGLLIELARQYFDLPDSPRLRTFVGDAMQYLQTTSTKYDMIIVDAFSGYIVPPHLLQQSTIFAYRQHLTKTGVVTINFIAEYKRHRPSIAQEIVAAFSEVFPCTAVYQSDPDYRHGEDQNLILAAGLKDVHFDYLQSREIGPA